MKPDTQHLRLAPEAETAFQSADDWWDTLGHHVQTRHDGAIAHPVCSVADLEAYDDDQIVWCLMREHGERPSAELVAAYESMVAYARGALEDARALATLLEAAVDAYEAGDLSGVLEALEDASRLENAYGDDPATQALRGQLLEEVEPPTFMD